MAEAHGEAQRAQRGRQQPVVLQAAPATLGHDQLGTERGQRQLELAAQRDVQHLERYGHRLSGHDLVEQLLRAWRRELFFGEVKSLQVSHQL